MDVERTMEFILEMQAKAEARMAKHDERMAKFDKRLEATRKLVEAGMKFVVKQHRESARQMAALREQTRKTSRDLDRLLDSWNKGPSNGHSFPRLTGA